jgi:uncharacterized repeat protein (TIGR03803 family)
LLEKFMRFACQLLTAGLILAGAASAAQAATETVLHSFCLVGGGCFDGRQPAAALVRDGAGNLYGTAGAGAHDQGIVFRLSPPGGASQWRYDVLYNFCNFAGCTDGSEVSQSPLIIDTSGRLYGMATNGGPAHDDGLVFRLTAKSRGTWVREDLYRFCFKRNACQDGNHPIGGLTYAGAASGLPYDGTSPLYGVTQDGGKYFSGVVFSLVEDAGHWRQKVLYAFCKRTNCLDGTTPISRPTLDGAGNLYGTANLGGTFGRGVIYKLTPGPHKWNETVLHNFCQESGCAGGFNSSSGLVLDAVGNMYGTTLEGGAGGPDCDSGCGALFKLDAAGTMSALHSFCSQADCVDGVNASNVGGLVLDASGNLFGTAAGIILRTGGLVFEYDGTTYQRLHDFCPTGDHCTNGLLPVGGLILDASGTFWGTTHAGGNPRGQNQGTVFELEP